MIKEIGKMSVKIKIRPYYQEAYNKWVMGITCEGKTILLTLFLCDTKEECEELIKLHEFKVE